MALVMLFCLFHRFPTVFHILISTMKFLLSRKFSMLHKNTLSPCSRITSIFILVFCLLTLSIDSSTEQYPSPPLYVENLFKIFSFQPHVLNMNRSAPCYIFFKCQPDSQVMRCGYGRFWAQMDLHISQISLLPPYANVGHWQIPQDRDVRPHQNYFTLMQFVTTNTRIICNGSYNKTIKILFAIGSNEPSQF